MIQCFAGMIVQTGAICEREHLRGIKKACPDVVERFVLLSEQITDDGDYRGIGRVALVELKENLVEGYGNRCRINANEFV